MRQAGLPALEAIRRLARRLDRVAPGKHHYKTIVDMPWVSAGHLSAVL